jgi:hypothetical protein
MGYHDHESDLIQNLIFMGLDAILAGEWVKALQYFNKVPQFTDTYMQNKY